MIRTRQIVLALWGLAALAVGLTIGIASSDRSMRELPEALSESLTAKRIEQLRQLDISDLQAFFSTPEPGLLFVYASADPRSQAQYHELLPLMHSMPTLALSVDPSALETAKLHATHAEALPFEPLVVLPRRVLATRAFLHARQCKVHATLPYIALTDGEGNCVKQWQGFIRADTIGQAHRDLIALTSPVTRRVAAHHQ